MTKQAAALLLAASLAVSVCATPVFAAGTPPVQNGQNVQDETTGENITDPASGKKACMQLKYNVTEGYTWGIPADIDFGKDNGAWVGSQAIYRDGTVFAKDCVLKNGYTLKISVAGNDGQYGMGTNHEFVIKTAEGAELGYSVKPKAKSGYADPSLTPGSVILSIAAGEDHKEAKLQFGLDTEIDDDDNAAEKAGEYIGYAIFTAQATN